MARCSVARTQQGSAQVIQNSTRLIFNPYAKLVERGLIDNDKGIEVAVKAKVARMQRLRFFTCKTSVSYKSMPLFYDGCTAGYEEYLQMIIFRPKKLSAFL